MRAFLTIVFAVASLGVLAAGLSSSSPPPPPPLPRSPPISSSGAGANAALERSWRLRTAVSTLQGIRGRDGGWSGSEGRKEDGGEKKKLLSLLHDFHDPKTGLCGEGVWHNAMLGVALVKASRRLREDGAAAAVEELGGDKDSATLADDYRSWARRLATNLFKLNYVNGQGFRRRSSSGIWESVDDSPDALEEEGGDFYRPGDERRCLSNAAAVLFATYLAEEFPDDDEVTTMADDCGAVFFEEFFDKKTGRFRYEAGTGDGPWRSSDQALGILACLRVMGSMKDGVEDGTVPRMKIVQIRTMAACAAEKLMDDFDFSPYATEGLVSPVNTIGGASSASSGEDGANSIPNYRNSWHDSLATFAILASNATSGRESPVGLCRFMARDYGIVVSSQGEDDEKGGKDDDEKSDDDQSSKQQDQDPRRLLLAHDVQENRFRDGPNAYASTQALWDACRRAVGKDIAGFGDFTSGFQSFHDESAVKQEGGNNVGGALSTVGTSYPMVRLWANTELAAWLLIDPADFSI